mgnify:CR=1 FL=1
MRHPLVNAYDNFLKKLKYHEKTLSEDAIYINWLHTLNGAPIFSRSLWLELYPFDLSQLGLGLLYDLLPIDFDPFSFIFEFEIPTPEEFMQGILIKFKRIELDELFSELGNIEEYIHKMIKEEHEEVLLTKLDKGYYDRTNYTESYYDPFLPREYVKSTAYRLRLERKPGISWTSAMDTTGKVIDIVEATNDHLYNRLMLHYAAMDNAFILGLAVLGRSRLTDMSDGYALIPYIDSKGRSMNVKVRTLDHIQLGFILGLIPLGYGLLMPHESIYRQPEGKKNPPILDISRMRIDSMKRNLLYTSLAYANYNRPEESIDVHKSDRTTQYDNLQSLRRHIEAWVSGRIPAEEANAVKIRQYQNAMLQAIGYRTKRHEWGFNVFKGMTDDEFRRWWVDNWSKQGLNADVLNRLYDDARIWLSSAIKHRKSIGETVKRIRRRMSLVTLT